MAIHSYLNAVEIRSAACCLVMSSVHARHRSFYCHLNISQAHLSGAMDLHFHAPKTSHQCAFCTERPVRELACSMNFIIRSAPTECHQHVLMKADGGHQMARTLLLLIQQTYRRPGPDQGPSLIVASLSFYKLEGQASGCGPHATVTLCPFSIRKWLPSRWLRSAIPPIDGMHFDVIFQV